MITHDRNTRWLVGMALMAAIVILLSATPLGMIQLPIIKATTVHIPVMIGAVLFGPLAGGILGGVFGICSMVSNTVSPTLLSFAFSPFLSTTGIPGMVKAIWVSVGCRILMGAASGWVWALLQRVCRRDFTALALTGFIGSLLNTILVMGSIYVLFAQQYAAARQTAITAVFGLVIATVATSGIPEALTAAILVSAIGHALLKTWNRIRKPAQT